MKAKQTIKVLAVLLTSLAAINMTFADQPAKDPTKYDCRVVVGYRTEPYAGNKPPRQTAILACPHKDKMAAGQCETSWLFGMRCKN